MTKDDILQLLRSSSSGFVSGARLAATMGVSRTAVWKHIRALEQDGYEIAAVPSKGYRLTSSPDLIIRGELLRGLRTHIIGKSVRYFPDTPSTNAVAMELAQRGEADGMVVLAEAQTAGRGRLGRTWVSPRGNLYLSVLLRPPVPVGKAPLLTLVGAVAVASAIRQHLELPAGIKWPNDILLAGRKVAGLLTELSAEQDRIRHVVLGIGVNVNMALRDLPPEVRRRSTTLAEEAGAHVDRTALLRLMLEVLDRWYGRFLEGEDAVLAAWKELNVTLGKRVTVSGAGADFTGIARGVDQEGRLLVRLSDGTLRQVAAGDVTIAKDDH
jgi:BirA family biotin operon repressor/biotin-[acetyl-CoA-carboxylase] ligase